MRTDGNLFYTKDSDVSTHIFLGNINAIHDNIMHKMQIEILTCFRGNVT